MESSGVIMSNNKENWLLRLVNLDQRYYYLALIILLVTPIIRPIGLPILVTAPTKDFYQYVNNNIQENDKILIWGGMSVGFWPTEYKPGVIAAVQHFFDIGAKIYWISDATEDPVICDQYVFPTIRKGSAVYGVNYVNLGYYSGGEMAMSAFAKDISSLVTQDYYRTPVNQLPMMREVSDANDFDFVIHITGSPPEWLLRQYNSAYGKDCGFISISGMMGIYLPYYASGQLVGFINGLRGGAEYETLTGNPGIGLASTDTVSTGHIFFSFLIVFTNVLYLIKRRLNKQ